MGLPQGGQRRLHEGPRPGRPVVRRRDRPRVAGRAGDHQGRPGDRRRPRRRDRVPRRRSSCRRSTRAGRSSSWSIRASCRPTSSTRSSGSGSRARRRRSTSRSMARRATRPSATGPTSTAASRTSARRWSTSSGPTTTRSTAGTRSGPYIDTAIQSTIDPDMAPPGKHVMSCFIQYAPYHLKGSDWDTEKERFGDTVQATLESFFPGFGDLVLQREIRTPLDIERTVGLSRGQHLRRRVPRAPDVAVPPGARLVAVPDADRRLLPVRLRHPSGRLRDGRAGQARRGPDPQGSGRTGTLRPSRIAVGV